MGERIPQGAYFPGGCRCFLRHDLLRAGWRPLFLAPQRDDSPVLHFGHCPSWHPSQKAVPLLMVFLPGFYFYHLGISLSLATSVMYWITVSLVSLYLAFQETSDQSVFLCKLTHLTPTQVNTRCIADAQHCVLSLMPAQPHLSYQPLLSHWNSQLQREVFIIPLPRLGFINSISSTHIHSTPSVTCPGYLASSLLWMKGFLEIPPAPCGLQATAWSFKTDLNF